MTLRISFYEGNSHLLDWELLEKYSQHLAYCLTYNRQVWDFWKFILFIYLGCTTRHVGSQFPDQGSDLCPLQWKLRVLTTELPGKSLKEQIKTSFFSSPTLLHFAIYLCVTSWEKMGGPPWNKATPTYLDNICRLVDVFFKDQDGGGIDIDAVLPCHLFCPSQTDIHISKWQVIFVCESSQLLGSNREEEMKLVAQHLN